MFGKKTIYISILEHLDMESIWSNSFFIRKVGKTVRLKGVLQYGTSNKWEESVGEKKWKRWTVLLIMWDGTD